jgi:predicted metalloprotease with PDZ domain
MKFAIFAALILNTALVSPTASAQFNDSSLKASSVSTGELPEPVPMPPPIAEARDIPFPGTIRLHIDTTDVARRIYRIHESIPVKGKNSITLLFPQWTPGDHSPNGPLEKLAGLIITARGKRLQWVRDTVAVYAFHVKVPAATDDLDVDYQYLGSTDRSTGYILIGPKMIDLQWQSAVLYPAGYFARDIVYQPSITLPDGWNYLSALDGSVHTGDTVNFTPVALDTLIDSPVMAGQFVKQVVLNDGPTPVRLDVAVNDPADLKGLEEAQRNLAKMTPQANKLFGGQHYDHYDYMLWLSNDFGPMYFEHHRSGENWAPADFLKSKDNRDSIARMVHGYVHSWNGMYRRPAEMWTPNFNTPERDSMLWVFEGLTDYWQDLLSYRTGIFSHDEILQNYAVLAAATTIDEAGAEWRNLQDTNNGPIIWFRKPAPWPTWQLDMFDPYNKGEIIWLNVDEIIRERSAGKRSLDDFAHSFYGGRDAGNTVKTYTFDDMVSALNAIQEYDWRAFFAAKLNNYGQWQSADIIHRTGYKLVFTDKATDETPSSTFLDLAYSVGMQVSNGKVVAVRWGGPAFNAHIAVGETVISVNGQPYTQELLRTAVVQSAKGGPIELVVKRGDWQQTTSIDWHQGLRYPHLERIEGKPALLDQIMSAKG